MSATVLIAIIGAAVAAAIMAGFMASWVMEESTPERRRIRSLATASPTGVVVAQDALTDSLDPVLTRLSKLVPKSPKEMNRIQRRLTRAGYPHLRYAVYFLLAQIACPILFGVIVFLFTRVWWHALLAAGLGYTVPGFYIERVTFLRKKAIRNGLPDALDLLTVCVEAGSGLDQAISKATEELQIAHPIISEELRIVTTEVYPVLDLRVDDHAEPIKELRRLYEKSFERFQPFVACLPSRTNAGGITDRAVIEREIERFHAERLAKAGG